MALDYEQQRLANIAANMALLDTLGLSSAAAPFKAKKKSTKPKPTKSKKRKLSHDEPRAPANDADEDESGSVEKLQKVEEDDGTVSGVRRSARNRGKKLDYKNDGDNEVATTRALPRVVSARARASMNNAPRDVSIRTHNP